MKTAALESRLAVLPNTTHITLMEKADAIIPMVRDFLDSRRIWRVIQDGRVLDRGALLQEKETRIPRRQEQ